MKENKEMLLNGNLAYEKLGNNIYLSLNDEIYILDNEVAIYIFELLKKQTEIHKIKEKVITRFSDNDNYSDQEKNQFIEEFIHDLIRNGIIIDDKTQHNYYEK